MTFTVALVGRPNVGKSTLFNRMTAKKLSIVDDTPGITRDWRSAPADFMGLEFDVVDTAGLEESFDDSIESRMRQSTENALKNTDFVLFMIDARTGLTPLDRHFAQWLREQNMPCALLANKCESQRGMDGLYEAYELGIGEPFPVSAEHNVGMSDVYAILNPLIEAYQAEQEKAEAENAAEAFDEDDEENIDIDSIDYEEGSGIGFGDLEDDEDDEDADPDIPIKLAIVGRPNAGKSTLLNALLDEDRAMTGPEPGITRDAISVDWTYDEQNFRLVDTAGIRRKARVIDKIEKFSVDDSFRAIRLAQVVILMLDADTLFERQDLNIASHVIEEGRALVIAINKWDVADGKKEIIEHAKYKLETSLPQVKNVRFVTISALHSRGLKGLMMAVMDAYNTWNKRVPTGGLNRWLAAMEGHHPAPLAQGRPNRLRYITQIKARPPTFALWVSKPQDLAESYQKYLINGLRETFDMPGTPIRFSLRTSKNPYVN